MDLIWLVKMDLVEDLEKVVLFCPSTGFEDVFLINFRQRGGSLAFLSKSFS